MRNKHLSRRKFIRNTTTFTLGAPFLPKFLDSSALPDIKKSEPILLHWLDGQVPENVQGVTWGVPWQRGTVKKGTSFVVSSSDKPIPTQSWALAYWPDGSLKWTAHAIASPSGLGKDIKIMPGKPPVATQLIKIAEDKETILVDTGELVCRLNKRGTVLIQNISRNGNLISQNGKLVLRVQDKPDDGLGTLKKSLFEGQIEQAIVEQKGELRTVIKIEGKHSDGSKIWLPFVVRLYFYAGSNAIRMMHTIVFDGNEEQDFICGLGVQQEVLLKSEFYNRHIRLVGNDGVFGESVQGLTGLRRDVGEKAANAQIEGKKIEINQFSSKFNKELLKYIPVWGDYSLSQLSPDSFDIQKRTQVGHSWIQANFGNRSKGTGYLGNADGGLAFGIRNFWQSFPAQLDIRDAHTDVAKVTLWLWSPKAPAMDLRFYHDGMGQDTFEKQRDGLDITYEDYEPGFGRPAGVARTSELQFWAMDATPSHKELLNIANQIQQPPLLIANPDYFQKVKLFGEAFSVQNTKTAYAGQLEKELDFFFNFYKKEIDARRWYGFWNYGDVMHSYDQHRHTWRYDIGGFAWDNSELSTDLWLWYYFLSTGRSDVFRLAEAMTRHTGEVDVHHMGPFSPLGSRHNVMHWGCSAKQLRISTAANRRFYFYLTADERVGDLLKEQVEAYRRLKDIIPGRKIGQKPPDVSLKGEFASIGFGTDWGAIASAWLTEWERTENPAIKERLLNSMKTIGEQPHGFFTGGAIMDLTSGKYLKEPETTISASHLSAAFGLGEICAELIDLVDMPVFEKAWLQYCVLYNATEAEQKAALGKSFEKLNLRQGHSRLTAYAAKRMKDAALARRAWDEFKEGGSGIKEVNTKLIHVETPAVLNPLEEAETISTNATAQWCLAAMQCLAYVGDALK
jgi:hypothetical protein